MPSPYSPTLPGRYLPTQSCILPGLARLNQPPVLVHRGQVSRTSPVISVVDDNAGVRTLLKEILEDEGHSVELFPDCEAYLDAHQPGRLGCILSDVMMPGMGGIEMLELLLGLGDQIPVVMMTGVADVSMAVKAMKAGAFDFLEKPFRHADLLTIVDSALDHAHSIAASSENHRSAARRMACLTDRQNQVLELVLAGHPSKNIAADLGISQRTVDNHRAAIARKTGSSSLPELIRLALTAN